MKPVYSAILILVLASPIKAADLPTSFQEAAKHEQDDTPVVRSYEKNRFTPFYKEKYGPIFASCFKSVNHIDVPRVEFIIILGADGKVLRLLSDRESATFSCVRKTLEKDTFPRPPIAPFYWRVEMRLPLPNSKLQFSSTPGTADIEIDDKYAGSTPSTLIG